MRLGDHKGRAEAAVAPRAARYEAWGPQREPCESQLAQATRALAPSKQRLRTSSLPIKSSDAPHCHCMSVRLLVRKIERGSAQRESSEGIS